MNKINVSIDFEKGTLEKTGIDLITGDYASTGIDFTFDESHNTGRKVFEMKSPSNELVIVKEIENNKVLLAAKDENENNVSLFNESGYYIFEVSYYDNDSKLTSVYGKIPVEQEQVVIDGEVVTPYLPIFDQLFSHVQEELEEMEEATEHLVEANTEAERIVSEFESNVEQYTEDFNTNAAEKTNAVNQIKSDVETLVNGFDSNVTAKTTQFNSNASEKLSNYNSNAESKLNEYNSNAESKLSDYNSNAIQKTTEFNTNAQEKTDEFNANKEKLQQELERYKLIENVLPKITGTGTELTLNNTADSILKLTPKASAMEQFTTDGNQVFNMEDKTVTVDNVTVTSKDGELNISGTNTNTSSHSVWSQSSNLPTFQVGETYSIKAEGIVTGEYIQFTYYNGSINKALVYISNANVYNVTIPDDFVSLVMLFVGIAGSVTTLNNKIKFMLAKGTYTSNTMPNFEKYTGEIPAPNSSYPQTIHTISGDNSVKVMPTTYTKVDYIESYGTQYILTEIIPSNTTGVYIKLQSKDAHTDRIFFGSKGESDSRFSLGNYNNTLYYGWNTVTPTNVRPTISNNTLYEIELNYLNSRQQKLNNVKQFDITETFNANNNPPLTIFGGNGWASSISYMSKIKLYSFKISDGNDIINDFIPCYRNSDGEVGLYDLINNVFYENSGVDAFTYGSEEEHQEQVVNIPLGNLEVCKMPNTDYKDEFYLATASDTGLTAGKWYLKKNISKVVLDGNTNIGGKGYELTNSYRFYTAVMLPESINGISLSNYFKNDFINNINTVDSPALTVINQKQIILRIDKTLASTEAELSTWLSTHNTTVYYVLATPTYTLLNDTLQNALNTLESKLLAYKGQTNISQVNNDLPFDIVASALKDISNL